MIGSRTMVCGALALALAAPAAAQKEIAEPGPYLHQGSGTVFPLKVGGFVRLRVVQYDAEGKDVSAGYDLVTPGGRVTLTEYVYPAPAAADAKAREAACTGLFEGAVQAISERHPTFRKAPGSDPVAVDGTEPALRHRAIYTYRTRFHGTEQPVRSQLDLYCYIAGDWLVKYRVTAPESVNGAAAVDAFIRTGPWPGRAMPEAEATAAGAASGG